MSRRIQLREREQSYERHVLFAVELLDAVTLLRVREGVDVIAQGLKSNPIVNSSGLFVWLAGDLAQLEKITIEPGTLPYQRVEIEKTEVAQKKLTTIELSPRPDYSFAGGVTALRGTLIEEPAPRHRDPVRDAFVNLQWLDQDGNWKDAPTISRTENSGDFAAVLRFAPTDAPKLDSGAFTVRLCARRGTLAPRVSTDLKMLQGHISEPATFSQDPNDLVFAWDQMHL